MFDLAVMFASCYSIFTNAYFAVFGLPMKPVEIIGDSIVEAVFWLDMIFSFFEEYLDEETYLIVTDFKSISRHYVRSVFLFDFTACFPIEYLFSARWETGPRVGLAGSNKLRLLRVLKLLRIPRLSQLLNVEKFKELLNTYYGNRLKVAVTQNDNSFHFPTMRNIFMVNAYRICRAVTIILTIAYFLAIAWLILAIDFQSDWQHNWLGCGGHCVDSFNGPNAFYTLPKHDFFRWTDSPDDDERLVLGPAPGSGYHFWATDMSDDQLLIKTLYYALTTLTTIGFGDMSPVSFQEKATGAVVLLLGVAVFSTFMNNLMQQIEHQKEIMASGQYDELTKWISLLTRFNGGKPLAKGLVKKIEYFFEYYWRNNRQAAVSTSSDARLYAELPSSIQE